MMDCLLLATGFTGALTLVFLARLLYRAVADTPSVSACFSPKGGCVDAIVQQLGRAKKDVLILARSFACEPLAKAVLDAKMRGVRVEIVLDRHNEKDPTSDVHLFAEQGLAPALDTHFPCCHDNLVLIDGRVLLTGSFDFTRQAEEQNSDSLLVIAGHPAVLAGFRKHFQDAKTHAQEFKASKADPPDTPKMPAVTEKPARKAA